MLFRSVQCQDERQWKNRMVLDDFAHFADACLGLGVACAVDFYPDFCVLFGLYFLKSGYFDGDFGGWDAVRDTCVICIIRIETRFLNPLNFLYSIKYA